MDARVEQAGVELEGPVEPRRVRIDEELRDVEAQTPSGIEGALRPQAVTGACADCGDMGVEDFAGAAGQANPGSLPVGFIIEGQEDRVGGAGCDGDIDPAIDEANAERLGTPRADAIRLGGAQVITDGAVRPVKCLIPASSSESAIRSARAAPVSMCWRAGSGSKRSI